VTLAALESKNLLLSRTAAVPAPLVL